MSFLANLIPVNLNEEKEKFFLDQTYNPQFIYPQPIDQKKLTKYGKTSQKYLEIAQHILEKAYFGKSEADLLKLRGPKVTQKEVEKTIRTFLQMHNLHKRFKIVFSASFSVRTSITPNVIKIRVPVSFTKQGLLGMVYHEIGTHALRRINYEQQPWFERKKEFGFSDHLKTEEGLASLHAILPRTLKSAYVPALRYITADFAQQFSFVETWEQLQKYIEDPEKRWRVIFRHKRGLTDTSRPGDYSKELIYFEGLVDVYTWLTKNNFDITKLYFGKIALKDVEKAFELNPSFRPALPSFFSVSKEKYAQEIEKIGNENFA